MGFSMNTISLFPTIIYSNKINSTSQLEGMSLQSFNRELIKECSRFSEIDKAGKEWCKKHYPNGYTSYGSISNLHEISSTFMTLQKNIDRHVKNYAKALHWDVDPKCLKMVSFWINIMPPKAAHSFHIHPLSVISGTYYVKTPKNCSAITFEDPRLDSFMACPPRTPKAPASLQNHYKVDPKAGQVVLFESWLRHEVPTNTTNDSRISVSFNYNWF
jgi:uncharacterized protein (TIGR02466 family)